ncbi:WG repeat-containing protein [Bacteroides ovatus]|nr:WG repeat-containing protein [Bacteroides ovatus]UVO69786.1 WG repeat-containing protein [Bacteroides ovatus]
MGFADTLGNVVIKPQFAFVCPFKDGKAEVTYTGEKKALDDYGEH